MNDEHKRICKLLQDLGVLDTAENVAIVERFLHPAPPEPVGAIEVYEDSWG